MTGTIHEQPNGENDEALALLSTGRVRMAFLHVDTDKEWVCAICLDEHTTSGIFTLACLHSFHWDCLHRSMVHTSASNKCPLCRQVVSTPIMDILVSSTSSTHDDWEDEDRWLAGWDFACTPMSFGTMRIIMTSYLCAYALFLVWILGPTVILTLSITAIVLTCAVTAVLMSSMVVTNVWRLLPWPSSHNVATEIETA